MFKGSNYQSPLGSPLKNRGATDENNSPMNSPLKQPRNLSKRSILANNSCVIKAVSARRRHLGHMYSNILRSERISTRSRSLPAGNPPLRPPSGSPQPSPPAGGEGRATVGGGAGKIVIWCTGHPTPPTTTEILKRISAGGHEAQCQALSLTSADAGVPTRTGPE